MLDALKIATNGRRDGRKMFYFGAIVDDNERELAHLEYKFKQVKHPKEARVRVRVTEANRDIWRPKAGAELVKTMEIRSLPERH